MTETQGGDMNLQEILKPVLPLGKFWTHSITAVSGCTKISPGCQNCWAEAMQMRFNGGAQFDGTVRENPERLAQILPKSNRRAPRVWTYWNDIFHEGVSIEFQLRLFNIIIESNDYHIICTKRPNVAVNFVKSNMPIPLKNVIILVTMEDQQRADDRMPFANKLLGLGWNVGALVEPMLGQVDLWEGIWDCTGNFRTHGGKRQFEMVRKEHHLSWIICGPENGHGKRPFDQAWAMRLQTQAKQARVPFLYKAGLLNGKYYHEVPAI